MSIKQRNDAYFRAKEHRKYDQDSTRAGKNAKLSNMNKVSMLITGIVKFSHGYGYAVRGVAARAKNEFRARAACRTHILLRVGTRKGAAESGRNESRHTE